MWIFTREGYFSIVYDSQYCTEDEVMVRARMKKDLVNMARKIGTDKPDIIKTKNADYLYRMKVTKDATAYYVGRQIYDIDYGNFKGNINPKDQSRHEAYFNCRAALLNWQEDNRR